MKRYLPALAICAVGVTLCPPVSARQAFDPGPADTALSVQEANLARSDFLGSRRLVYRLRHAAAGDILITVDPLYGRSPA
jgi:hypothetical protein